MSKNGFVCCILALALLLSGPSPTRAGVLPGAKNDKTTSKKTDPLNTPPPALLLAIKHWVESADFWRLAAQGEYLQQRVEIIAVESDLIEAWACGRPKVCVSKRLLREFSPDKQEAVIAHELSHMLIPRDYQAHSQLWEVQCDLLAVALLRDQKMFTQMLESLATDCRTCADEQHPSPGTRLALVETFADEVMAKVLRFDQLRAGNFAVKVDPKHTATGGLLAQVKRLNFAVRTLPIQAVYLAELQALDFTIGSLEGLPPCLSFEPAPRKSAPPLAIGLDSSDEAIRSDTSGRAQRADGHRQSLAATKRKSAARPSAGRRSSLR